MNDIFYILLILQKKRFHLGAVNNKFDNIISHEYLENANNKGIFSNLLVQIMF